MLGQSRPPTPVGRRHETGALADALAERRAFLAQVVVEPRFQAHGVAYGQDGDFAWVVLDPRRHPLHVWRENKARPGGYASTARDLGAAVFTNGPMMGKRLAPAWKMGRRTAMAEIGLWTGLAALTGLLAGRGVRGRLAAGGFGAALGFAVAWARVFTNWVPCGTVRGLAAGIEDGRNFDAEGARHVWFGRVGDDFSSYHIGDGDLPPQTVEGAGGMLLLLRDFTLADQTAGAPGPRVDFAELHHKKGVVAWGLAPLSDAAGANRGDGVLVVVASPRATAAAAAVWLASIGTRDAASTDQRAMIMLGRGAEFLIGPPPLNRQAMQQYGFFCA